MQIIIITGLLCVSGIATLIAQQKPAVYGLKGDIKTLVETYHSKELGRDSMVTNITIRTSAIDREGRISQVHSRSYSIGKKPKAEQDTITTYGFPDTLNMREVYYYNGKGLLASITEYTEANGPDPSRIIEYTYDDSGRELTELIYYPFMQNAERVLYKMTYDVNGHIFEKIKFAAGLNEELQENAREKFNYDDAGNLTEKFAFDYESESYWRDYSATYNIDKKRTGSQNYLPDGGIWKRDVDKYDQSGELMESVVFDANDITTTILYTHEQPDSAGNFLKETHYMPGSNPYFILERKIEYY